jgi:hypothetical protein
MHESRHIYKNVASRSCCLIQAALGVSVTAMCRSFRRPSSRITNTYSALNPTLRTTQKSIPHATSIRFLKNAFHVPDGSFDRYFIYVRIVPTSRRSYPSSTKASRIFARPRNGFSKLIRLISFLCSVESPFRPGIPWEIERPYPPNPCRHHPPTVLGFIAWHTVSKLPKNDTNMIQRNLNECENRYHRFGEF